MALRILGVMLVELAIFSGSLMLGILIYEELMRVCFPMLTDDVSGVMESEQVCLYIYSHVL